PRGPNGLRAERNTPRPRPDLLRLGTAGTRWLACGRAGLGEFFMDAFDSAFASAQTVRATARVKMPDGVTRTINLHAVPDDMSAESFAASARHGIDQSARVAAGDDRSRNKSAKGIFGAAAEASARLVLGITAPSPKPPAKGKGKADVPAALTDRSALPAPS